jgi:NADPH-dependent 2,4-dienoyl-CoA reductase/sulfur reductase-like enzyme/nitrite reductase/ring-hydroxylating ferredoxin subunit
MTNDEREQLTGPDLALGYERAALVEGKMVLGHAQGEAVVLAQAGGECFALSARCTHYGGNLAHGMLVGKTIRCPLHHAAFCLRSGKVLAPPALDAVPCWTLEEHGQRIFVIGKAKPLPSPPPSRVESTGPAQSPIVQGPIVIVGGGAAGLAAAETLRQEGYAGRLTMLSAEHAPPSDRPNFKHYLAGMVPEEWIPLRPATFFQEHRIELVLGARVVRIDRAGSKVVVENGESYSYERLLLATGAAPAKLGVPGSELPHVHTLRTLEDSRAILAACATSRHAVVVGASFIGLESAAALRKQNLEVRVVAPESRPLERILGPRLGDFVRALHEAHGVKFHFGQTVRSVEPDTVTLSDGARVPADLVVAGVGVRPNLALAEAAGLVIDRGVVVDAHLETSVPGIYAAGDLARWPDPHTGEQIRVEHWVVAQRQGQIAARNMFGKRERCDLVPFFWTRQYDVSICYVGHAERWDEVEEDGNLARRDFRIRYRRSGRTLAVATVGRDLESLRAEMELERSRAGADGV